MSDIEMIDFGDAMDIIVTWGCLGRFPSSDAALQALAEEFLVITGGDKDRSEWLSKSVRRGFRMTT